MAGATLLIHACGSGPSFVRAALGVRPLVYVGLISFSLYLVHWPLIVLTRFALGLDAIEPWIPVLLVTSFVLAALSHRYVEQPFRKVQALSRRGVFAATATATALLIAFSAWGIRANGFETRFDPIAVAQDRAARPAIPFVECDGRAPADWCTLGAPGATPTVLLWGDSHLLAWGPAFDEILRQQGRRALFVPSSSCPPLLGVDLEKKPGCAEQNARVLRHLERTPELNQIVLAGFWRSYFEGLEPLRPAASTPGFEVPDGTEADTASVALTRTLHRLSTRGRSTVLLGPLPAYEKNVPLALALQTKLGRNLLPMPLEVHRARHDRFLRTVQALDAAVVRYVDPSEWLCRPDCATEREGTSLYRDDNHLSRAGALALQPELARALTFGP